MQESEPKIVRDKRIEISDYYRTLLAILCLRSFVIDKLEGKFYFGSNLNYTNQNGRQTQTPDAIIQYSDNVWVGEVKKSLRGRNGRTEEEYLKEYIEGDLIEHLKKYDEPFKELKVEQHDLFLFAPARDTDAIGYLTVKYLEEKEKGGVKVFENNFALITYSIENGANTTQFIILNLKHGSIKDNSALTLLRMGYRMMLGELDPDRGRYKVYEESDKTPIEYVMLILWTEIFPDLIEKSMFEKIIEWKEEKGHYLEINQDTLVRHLQELYTLPFFNGNDHKQFRTQLIAEAMELFSKFEYKNERTGGKEPRVQKIQKDGDVSYKIVYSKLTQKDELGYILNTIYSDAHQAKLQEYE